MSQQSLEALLQTTSPVKLLRNSQLGAHVYPVVPAEYSNWRDEQYAWQHACVLFNQSYHMTDMYVEGPGALKLLSDLGINTFKNFGSNKAKQFVPCSPEGYVIGDVILFGLEENVFNLVGRPSVHNWVQYHCETGGYDAKVTRDERSAARADQSRMTYRYQVQIVANGQAHTLSDQDLSLADGESKQVVFTFIPTHIATNYQIVIRLLGAKQQVDLRLQS